MVWPRIALCYGKRFLFRSGFFIIDRFELFAGVWQNWREIIHLHNYYRESALLLCDIIFWENVAIRIHSIKIGYALDQIGVIEICDTLSFFVRKIAVGMTLNFFFVSDNFITVSNRWKHHHHICCMMSMKIIENIIFFLYLWIDKLRLLYLLFKK